MLESNRFTFKASCLVSDRKRFNESVIGFTELTALVQYPAKRIQEAGNVRIASHGVSQLQSVLSQLDYLVPVASVFQVLTDSMG